MAKNLVAETLRKGLYTRVIGKRILFFQELSSTMDEAARQATLEAQEGTVVVAESQTASRGRFGRTWVSQPDNLYVSIILSREFGSKAVYWFHQRYGIVL